ncbi:MAG TPA: DUF1003 domain-containing protein [Thermodesulfovibrionales bacterium]|nr:DUF1003 domain-containing protein [Thermodesulfovibrionales bacterium]
MSGAQHETVLCQVCKQHKRMSQVLSAEMIREVVAERIRATHPDWSVDGFICIADLNRIRAEYVQDVIKEDKGELSALEQEVVESLRKQELLSENINDEYDKSLTLGERVADKLADFGGSWRFIGMFSGMLFLWMIINSALLVWKPFDPYPFIFLNLILSCLAAIQAPVIMMSQNRQEARDRLQAEHDYRINLKAELEIRHLHEKVDHLLMNQWQRLLEIQQIQMELMEELAHKKTMRP